MIPTQPDESESNEIAGREVRLVYKALHMLPNVGGSYVISLFESKDAEGGLIVRAFDRAKRDAFWLSLSKTKVASLGGNAAQSPTTLAAALSRRLKLKPDVATGSKRLVLPPAKKVESHKKKKDHVPKRATQSVSDVSERPRDGAEEEAGATIRVPDGVGASSSLPSTENEPKTAAPECPAQTKPQPRRSHPPPTRGSKSDDLGPLVETEGDGSEYSAEDFGDCRSVSSSADPKQPATSTGELVPQRLEVAADTEDNSVRGRTVKFSRAGYTLVDDCAGSVGGFAGGWGTLT